MTLRDYPIACLLARVALLLLVSGDVRAEAPPSFKDRFFQAGEADRAVLLEEYRRGGSTEALAFAVDLLRYPDMKVKMDAALVLREWGPESYPFLFRAMDDFESSWLAQSVLVDQEARATPFLKGRLASSAVSDRVRAASLLGKTRDPAAVPTLIPLLRDPSREVKIQVILALGEMENRQALASLTEVFVAGDPLLTEYAIQAIERFGWQAARALKESLHSENPRIRNGAVLVLKRLRVPESQPDLLEALHDTSLTVRLNAIAALGLFRDKVAAGGLIEVLGDPDYEVREAAGEALARMGSEMVPLLLERLPNADPVARRGLMMVLRRIGDKRIVPSFIRLLNDPDEAVRTYAVTGLMEMGERQAIKPLVERLKVETEIQWLIGFALQSMSGEGAEALLSAVGDEEFCQTRNLILLRMGEKAMDTLMERARKGSGQPRYTAIVLLGQLGHAEAVPALESLLPDQEVGIMAANSLGRLGQEGWEALRRALRQGEGGGRRNALAGISTLDRNAADALVECLYNDDAVLRAAACSALERAGSVVVPRLARVLDTLPTEGCADAGGVLCRITDTSAEMTLSAVLFPKGETPALVSDQARMDWLRREYAERGSISSLRERLKAYLEGREDRDVRK